MVERNGPPDAAPAPSTDDRVGSSILSGNARGWRVGRKVFSRIPASPRCKMCAAPFGRPGSIVMRRIGKAPWPKNPRDCASCFRYLSRNHGGAEISCSLMFVDVRGSTTIAEHLRPAEFKKLMEGFYTVAAGAIVRNDGIVDKFVGDEVVGIFIPALCGENHARKAIQAGVETMRDLHGGTGAGGGLAIGAGANTGIAYVGGVGEGDHIDLTAMGDPVNVTARLASAAGPGEVLVTAMAAEAAGLATAGLERRSLALKGKTEAVDVVVVRAPG